MYMAAAFVVVALHVVHVVMISTRSCWSNHVHDDTATAVRCERVTDHTQLLLYTVCVAILVCSTICAFSQRQAREECVYAARIHVSANNTTN